MVKLYIYKKESEDTYLFNSDYIKKIYVEDGYDRILKNKNFKNKNMSFFFFSEVLKTTFNELIGHTLKIGTHTEIIWLQRTLWLS